MSKHLNLNPKALLIESGVGDEIAVLLGQAIEQHTETGRSASVTLKITVKADKETGASKARGRVSATIPDGDDDQIVKRMPSVSLLTVTNDHPGQQRIDDAMPDDDPLTVESVIARLNLAIEASGKSASVYAKKYSLPYLALSKLLATGLVGGDTAAYGAIYDHAKTLDFAADAEPEQDGKSRAAG